ncbi:hypothetical protein ON010_g7790 [Phytophthora cinnamomi]|nr:hypothetical protein ON010_g7790 [Phytophthora cinnamomi]
MNAPSSVGRGINQTATTLLGHKPPPPQFASRGQSNTDCRGEAAAWRSGANQEQPENEKSGANKDFGDAIPTQDGNIADRAIPAVDRPHRFAGFPSTHHQPISPSTSGLDPIDYTTFNYDVMGFSTYSPNGDHLVVSQTSQNQLVTTTTQRLEHATGTGVIPIGYNVMGNRHENRREVRLQNRSETYVADCRDLLCENDLRLMTQAMVDRPAVVPDSCQCAPEVKISVKPGGKFLTATSSRCSNQKYPAAATRYSPIYNTGIHLKSAPSFTAKHNKKYGIAYDKVTDALINGDDDDGDEDKVGESASARAQPADLAGMEYVLYLLWRWHHDMRTYAVIGMIYLLFIFLPVGQLAGFHIYLTARNRTTNELLNADRYRFQRGGELRSYDRGIVSNVAERFLGLGGEPVDDDDSEVKVKLLDEQLSSVPV